MTSRARKLRRVVVVGGSVAALRAVEELRARGHDGTIDLVSEEARLPYERPPLSKDVLVDGAEPLQYRDHAWFADNGVVLHLGCRATGLDPVRRVVSLGDDALPYDGLVVATGARPRNPWEACGLQGVLTLRTLDDAHALRRSLRGRPSVVVVGAGFIGSEVASSARALGCAVRILEAAPAPLVRAVGAVGGRLLAGLHGAHGVDLRCGVAVASFGGRDRVEWVETTAGERVPADVVVVGVGVAPNVEWLAGSGLRIADGLVCDRTLCAGPPEVFAAGDVASFDHPRFGMVRTEQWTTASLQGQHAAASLLRPDGQAEAFAAPPYFWSDQYGSRVQLLGMPSDEPLVDLGSHDGDARRWAVGWSRDGRLSGVMALDWPQRIASLRGAVVRGDPVGTLAAAV